MTDEQKATLDNLRLRLVEWDHCGEGKYSAVDFAAASRQVLSAFGFPVPVKVKEGSQQRSGQ